MPVAGDVLETSLCGEFFGQQTCNVFYWVVAAWTGNMTIQEFADQLADQIMDVVAPMQVNTFSYSQISLYNLTNTGEKTTRPLVRVGESNLEGDAPFMALPLKLIGENELTRDGWKRIGGISEAAAGTGGVIPANIITLMNALGAFLSAEVVVDDGLIQGGTLTPVIVGTDSATGGKDISVVNPIGAYEAQQYATTQNTRKRGRGN